MAQKQGLQGFAIVRVDDFQDETVPFRNRITVKRIVWDEQLAAGEVDRLNRLNPEGSHYFWQTTRVDRPTQSTGE